MDQRRVAVVCGGLCNWFKLGAVTMMIGCCHCESESTPSESSSGSSGSSASIELIPNVNCGVCVVAPRRWKITVTGWTGLTSPQNACCGSLNTDFIIRQYTKPPFSTSCVVYRSDEITKNQISSTAPTCVAVGIRRLVLGQLDNNFPAPNSSLVISISVATGGTAPSNTYQNEVYSIQFNNSAACIVGGVMNYVTETGTGPLRCLAGATVTAVPI